MARRRRILFAALLVLLLLPVGLVITMRARRDRWDTPVAVRGSVVRLRNSFTEIYGARIGDKVVLFDAGIDTEGRALDALLAHLSAGRDDVSDVFLTHGHFDHVAASPLCKKARIHVGADDVEMMARRAPIEPFVARMIEHIVPVGPVAATDPYQGRMEIAVGDKTVTAVPLPGHTPGSYLLFFDGVLLAGDSIQISDGKLQFAMEATTVNPLANRVNLSHVKELLGPLAVDVVCTGHQGCTAAGDGARLLDDLIARASR
jgi:glyoxylase-like metal-dependent hydrolase (beta-lactamase superfamily II)